MNDKASTFEKQETEQLKTFVKEVQKDQELFPPKEGEALKQEQADQLEAARKEDLAKGAQSFKQMIEVDKEELYITRLYASLGQLMANLEALEAQKQQILIKIQEFEAAKQPKAKQKAL